ncbi:MAG: hypothetical protein BGO38_15925 [Cellulomonas sp. 73-145]|nr:MAG: hypothetical protein BGO38_15925 [Cellulomonas sp. 73-145]
MCALTWQGRQDVRVETKGASLLPAAVDPMPMMDVFDKQLTLRFGQAKVRRWVDDLMPLVSDPSDPLGVLDPRTHRLPLAQAPGAYAMFQRKEEGCIKVVLDPEG